MHSYNLRHSRETDDRDLVQEILGYLLQNPEAQDTAEGIAEWWLLDRRIERVVAEVRGALKELVSNELLVAWQTEDGRMHYRLNREREREVLQYLRKPDRAATPTGNDGERSAG